MLLSGSRRILNRDSSKKIVEPSFLVEVDNYSEGCKKVLYFLDQTALVKYETVDFNPDMSCSAADKRFWTMVESGLENNRQSVTALIEELQESGYRQLLDLTKMKQGYESKILHILVHFLDGFIGIDSSFYNLIEDSHQISDSLHRRITENPQNYWLFRIDAENKWTLL